MAFTTTTPVFDRWSLTDAGAIELREILYWFGSKCSVDIDWEFGDSLMDLGEYDIVKTIARQSFYHWFGLRGWTGDKDTVTKLNQWNDFKLCKQQDEHAAMVGIRERMCELVLGANPHLSQPDMFETHIKHALSDIKRCHEAQTQIFVCDRIATEARQAQADTMPAEEGEDPRVAAIELVALQMAARLDIADPKVLRAKCQGWKSHPYEEFALLLKIEFRRHFDLAQPPSPITPSRWAVAKAAIEFACQDHVKVLSRGVANMVERANSVSIATGQKYSPESWQAHANTNAHFNQVDRMYHQQTQLALVDGWFNEFRGVRTAYRTRY